MRNSATVRSTKEILAIFFVLKRRVIRCFLRAPRGWRLKPLTYTRFSLYLASSGVLRGMRLGATIAAIAAIPSGQFHFSTAAAWSAKLRRGVFVPWREG